MAHSTHPDSQVKRFTAPTMRRALEMVSAELGPEAIILSSQRTASGVEIVTSLEPDLPTRGIDTRREFGQKFDAELDRPLSSDSAWRSQAGVDEAALSYSARAEINGSDRTSAELAREIEKASERMLAAKRDQAKSKQFTSRPMDNTQRYQAAVNPNAQRPATVGVPEPRRTEIPDDEQRLEALQSEIADMRLILEQQMWRMTNQSSQINMPQQVKLPVNYSLIEEHLSRLGLSEQLTSELVNTVAPNSRPSHAWRDCMSQLSKRVPVLSKDLIAHGGSYAFVGPTGVGKTTTIAKLAARFVLENGAGKVAIVTTDTYRVGAHDQLRSLGRILGVPVRAVDKNQSLLAVLASLKQIPLVLVDTAGFRQGDPLLKEQLSQLDACPGLKRILVVASNSQLQSLKASTHAYATRRGIDACVLTKLDEAISLGEAISVVLEKSLPLAYTTAGQEIPKDIERATGHGLVAKAVSMLKDSINQTQGIAAF